MARVSLADRGRLSWLALRRGLDHAAARVLSHPLLQRPSMLGRADRVVIAPQDLRTADPTRAAEIYGGRFAFAGKVVTCDGRSVFEMMAPSEEWADTLLSFGWLRHLRAAESAITRAHARALVGDWIAQQGTWDSIGWRTETTARRVIAWLTQASLILDDSDEAFYRRFLRNLSRQVRYLRLTARDTRDGVPRLQARIALAYASLTMGSQAGHLRRATRRLSAELDRQILPDGGHISRNPGALIELLLDLLPLAQAFTARNVQPPPALTNAVDRMMPMLRFFRHSEGTFAHFNGMGATPADRLSTLLAYDETHGTPFANAPHSGYQRLEAGGAVLLMDTGRAPPIEMSLEAHAGCLSFEFSTPKQALLVVNCGVPASGRESWRQVARATAAHSTVTFNNTSSARFVEAATFKRMLGGSPMLGGPRHVVTTREEGSDGTVLRTAHDGYADRFDIVHERVLMLAFDGLRLDGEDVFLDAGGEPQVRSTQDEFAVRFHLHPTVKATRLSDGHGVMLMMPNRDVWTFSAHEDQVELEDSVYLAGSEGPRRTTQLVIRGRARTASRVLWSFQRAPTGALASTNAARRAREEEPRLPL